MTSTEHLRKARDEPPPYDERYVALVDILGWKEIVKKSVEDPSVLPRVSEAAEIIGMAPEYAKEINQNAKHVDVDFTPDIRVSHFSDHVFLSFPKDAASENLLRIMVATLCRGLLDARHYTRGAVVCDFVRHTSSVLYGPAVSKAVELEQEVAKYPRIVVAPSAHSLFTSDTALRTDFDGLKHLDILRPPSRPGRDDVDWLEGLKAMSNQKLEVDQSDLKVVAKHLWFRGYVDEVLDRARREMSDRPMCPG